MFTLLFLFSSASSFITPDAYAADIFINHINSHQNLWIAGHQEIPKAKVIRNLMRSKHVAPSREEDIAQIQVAESIPDHYDVRDQWSSKCVSVNNIRDQSDCGSCWAVAAAATISDRTCIASNGAVNTLLSAEDLLSCCTVAHAGINCGDGCQGGYPFLAWRYWVRYGLSTGGSYESQFGCKPYSIAPCGETVNWVTYPKCDAYEVETPKCVEHCTTNISYPIPYQQDKHYGASAYSVGQTVDQIQTEIMRNGPVEVGFTVYSDFYHYKSGIYKHVAGEELGGHAVKLLGWGVENGTPYWLAANSWNVNWGENGYFRILRSVNECGIERAIVAGIPDLNRKN